MRRRIGMTGDLPRLFWGRVPQRAARRLGVRLSDDRFMSETIRSGFFLFTVSDPVLAHAGPQALVARDEQGRLVAREEIGDFYSEPFAFGGIQRPPGGADLARKHRLVAVGEASIWAAPSSLRPARCTWLQIGRGIYGGGCRRYQAPARGLAEVVPLRLRVKGKVLTVLWGQAGRDVARLEVLFQDGSRESLSHANGVFLYPVPAERWRSGHRPAFLVARDQQGRILGKRLLYEYTLAPA